MNLEINEILDSDIHEYGKLYVQVFNSPPWNENWTLTSAIERLDFYRRTPGFIGLCAKQDSELLAFIFGNYEPYQQGRVYLIKEMCVAIQSQQQGIGTSMLQALHSLLLVRDISLVNLITRTGQAAEKFYLKNQYTQALGMGLYVRNLKPKVSE